MCVCVCLCLCFCMSSRRLIIANEVDYCFGLETIANRGAVVINSKLGLTLTAKG